MPVIGHKTIAAIRRLNINGHGLKWETSVGKLVIGKGSDRYIVIIGSKSSSYHSIVLRLVMGFGIGIYALIVLREGLSFTLEVRT